MKLIKVIISFLILVSFSKTIYGYDSLRNKLKALKEYAESVDPVYIIDGDTFVIAKLSRPPDSINSFLDYFKKNNVTEAYKYAFLQILKLKLAYKGFDYDFCNYYYDYPFADNGIIDLAMHAMGIEYDSIGCAFTKTYDVYLWLLKHKEIYVGYKPMETYMRKIKKRLKDTKRTSK